MELEEDKISLACIKQYLVWLFYSLSLVAIINIPCVIVLVVSGLLSGEM